MGDRCNSHTKGIGLTLDDILRNAIQQNTAWNNQPFLVKMGAAVTMIMFVGGLINSVLSVMTFQNVDSQKVGCGMYLLASSITSLLTISMLTIKFWLVVQSQTNTSLSRSTLRFCCISVEPLLKVFFYLDTWLNACVAVERAVHVSKGVRFNKQKSKRIARWIISILPFLVIMTIVHEPIHRDLLEYTTEKYRSQSYENRTNDSVRYDNWINASSEYEMTNHVLCVIRYSRSMQHYNTAILFFHLISPFIANLLSALYIIFGAARHRSIARTTKTFKEHVLEQLSEHKQLVISPVSLLILSLPRLIISLVSGCVDASKNPWLYLCGYFISFTPSMLVFVVFVFPSEQYMKTFKETLQKWRRRTHQ